MKFNERFNKEYIMKAVHHCVDDAGCADCPYEFAPECSSIEELLYYIKELTEENEFHRKTISKNTQMALNVTVDEIEKTKADTVRKMQQRLTSDEFYIVADSYDGMQYVDFCAWVEEIAKEVLEESK